MSRHSRPRAATRWSLVGTLIGVIGVAAVLAAVVMPAADEPRQVTADSMTMSAVATQARESLATAIERATTAEKNAEARSVARAEAPRMATAEATPKSEDEDEPTAETSDEPSTKGDGGGGSESEGTGSGSTTAAPAPGAQGKVMDLVNQERASAGCGPVHHDAGLARVARAHSADMARRGFFDHTNPDGLGPFDRARRSGVDARAENIAAGHVSPAAVMRSWMNSSGHRANILNCDLTRLGVGRATGGSYGTYWTQLFG